MTLTFLPASTNRCSKSFTCVVFPLRSSPSSTTSAPRPCSPCVDDVAMAAAARSFIEAIADVALASDMSGVS